jgi:2-alkyl-3-oxoalkanoate reductase
MTLTATDKSLVGCRNHHRFKLSSGRLHHRCFTKPQHRIPRQERTHQDNERWLRSATAFPATLTAPLATIPERHLQNDFLELDSSCALEWVVPRVGSRRILVTGASGFVGGRVANALEWAGHDVVRVGRRKLDRSNYISCDLAEKWPIEKLKGCDVVVHAAARASPWGPRRAFVRDNIDATRNLLAYCAAVGNPRIVHLSSSSVYYRAEDQLGISESTPLPRRFVNTYAETKRASEEIVEQYPGVWSILRPRAVFGPGDTVLLPRILEAARRGKLPFLYRAGTPVVGDLIYVDNLVDQIAQAATRDGIAGTVNVSNGEPIAVMDLILAILHRMGIPSPSRRVSVRQAMFAATLLEWAYQLGRVRSEPPITRFGVHVFAYSKTFDVTRMLQWFGPPKINLDQGIDRTVRAWSATEKARG